MFFILATFKLYNKIDRFMLHYNYMSEQHSSTPISQIDKRSWLQRLGSSIKGVVTGLAFFVIAFPLIIWNEAREIQTYRSLEEGASAVINVSAEQIDSQHDGQLIHITGEARTPSVLTDDTFAISENALKLKRIVEIYQWSEEKQSETVEKLGGSVETTTTYTYKEIWDDRLINSQDFKDLANHRNPQIKPLENEEKTASPISVGAYTLSDRLIASLTDYQRLDLANDLLTTLTYAQQEQWQVFNNYVYQSADPSNPEIGDVRVYYQIIRPSTVSIIAQQNGPDLQAYQTKQGKSIEMVRLGQHSATEMFEGAVQANHLTSWLFRFLAFIFMYLGLKTILAPLAVLGSVIPLFAKILRFGSNLVSGIIALLLSLIIIGIAWLSYRPLIGLAILAAAALIFILITYLKNKPIIKKEA